MTAPDLCPVCDLPLPTDRDPDQVHTPGTTTVHVGCCPECAPIRWRESHQHDPYAVAMADRHYSRQSPGSPQFTPPGRRVVLVTDHALWVTSWPQFVTHAWRGAWVCSLFRREEGEPTVASELVRQAVAVTRWRWPVPPPAGMVTFVDERRVRPKRDPGRCFRRAGFHPAGRTKGGLLVLQLDPADMPEPAEPQPMTGRLLTVGAPTRRLP